MDIKHTIIPAVYTSCYLLCDPSTRKAAVIDPGGAGPQTVGTIGRWLADEGYTLTHILLTHGHYDHVGGVSALCRYDPAVYLHRADAKMPVSDLFPLPRQAGDAFTGFHFYGEGDHISVGSLDVAVLHTPGHTPGSVCLRCENALFTGDTLFAGSMGRTDFVGGKGADMAASLKRLGELEGDFILYPGHGEFTTLERERAANPYLKMAMEGRL